MGAASRRLRSPGAAAAAAAPTRSLASRRPARRVPSPRPRDVMTSQSADRPEPRHVGQRRHVTRRCWAPGLPRRRSVSLSRDPAGWAGAKGPGATALMAGAAFHLPGLQGRSHGEKGRGGSGFLPGYGAVAFRAALRPPDLRILCIIVGPATVPRVILCCLHPETARGRDWWSAEVGPCTEGRATEPLRSPRSPHLPFRLPTSPAPGRGASPLGILLLTDSGALS